MKKGERAEAHVHIRASPEEVYDLVSDVTRMGEWSPETVACEWLGDANGPRVGARFTGTNKRGILRWTTVPEVTAAERGREFAFATPRLRRSLNPRDWTRSSTEWRYRFATHNDGTDVIESFEMLDNDPPAVPLLARLFMRTSDRKADMQRGMQETLLRLKRVAEQGDG